MINTWLKYTFVENVTNKSTKSTDPSLYILKSKKIYLKVHRSDEILTIITQKYDKKKFEKNKLFWVLCVRWSLQFLSSKDNIYQKGVKQYFHEKYFIVHGCPKSKILKMQWIRKYREPEHTGVVLKFTFACHDVLTTG